jgi:hypothetical protein
MRNDESGRVANSPRFISPSRTKQTQGVQLAKAERYYRLNPGLLTAMSCPLKYAAPRSPANREP